MAINLEKKQKFDLTKNSPTLKNIFYICFALGFPLFLSYIYNIN